MTMVEQSSPRAAWYRLAALGALCPAFWLVRALAPLRH